MYHDYLKLKLCGLDVIYQISLSHQATLFQNGRLGLGGHVRLNMAAAECMLPGWNSEQTLWWQLVSLCGQRSKRRLGTALRHCWGCANRHQAETNWPSEHPGAAVAFIRLQSNVNTEDAGDRSDRYKSSSGLLASHWQLVSFGLDFFLSSDTFFLESFKYLSTGTLLRDFMVI